MEKVGNRLNKILELANEEHWEYYIPNTPLRLGIAIDSLNRSYPKFWNMNAGELEEALRNNPGVSAQFNCYDEILVGFAIRTLRIREERSG